MKLRINPSVFREYDIRGIAGEDLSNDFAERLGLAYSEYMWGRVPTAQRSHLTVSVGEDCRVSSPAYADALVAGLRKGGIDVVRLGTCPTPATYFSLFHLNLDGGIMITASHLPAQHNGFKICVGHDTIFGDEIQKLRYIMERDFEPKNSHYGTVSDFEIIPVYLDHLVKNAELMRGKKIVVDCGNGNGSQVVPQLFRRLEADVTELFCEMDGTFPNHVPDPSVEKNLTALIAKVKETHADFGIGIDGDADRVGIVDEKGRLLYGDELLVIFSRDLLRAHPGATIISEVKSSFKLYEDIAKNGGKPIMWKAGHSLIKAKMKETHALLGGEMSGHMFFADRYYGFDDAIYAALRAYEIAGKHDGPFSELLDGLPKTVSTPELRVKCEEKEKFAIVAKLTEELQHDPALAEKKFTLVDGVRVDFGDGWGMVRASNTEPVLSIRFEAVVQNRLNEIQNLFFKALKNSGLNVQS